MSHYQIIGNINQARTNPQRTGITIHQYLSRHYRHHQLTAYGKRIDTFQGIDALHDLKEYLCSIQPIVGLIQSVALNRAAEIIAREKGGSGSTTHQKPRVINEQVQVMSRLQGKVGELICLAANQPEQIATYFLLDDGLLSRKRRRMLLDPIYKFIGIGQSTHAVHGHIAVILLAESVQQR